MLTNVKKPKAKYFIGDCLKVEDSKYLIKEVQEGYYLVTNLTDASDTQISFDTKVKKCKALEKELVAFEKLNARKNSSPYIEKAILHDWIEFPNEKNLEALKNCKEFGFDIETYGIEKIEDALIPEKGRIRLIQVYIPSISKCIIWDCGDLKNPKDVLSLEGIGILRKKLNSHNCKKFIHNANFEGMWIGHHLKCPINSIVDSMILSQIYWAGLSRGFNAKGVKNPNSLEQVALRVLGVKPDKTNQGYDYGLPLGNSQLNYAALDAKLTLECGTKLLEMCYADGLQKVVDADLSAIPAFTMMNYKGIPTNKSLLEEIKKEYEKAANEKIAPWLTKFPGTNPNSPKQVLECLKKEWGIEPTALNSKGVLAPCSDNATLTPYALENPLIESLLMYRSLTKDVDYLSQYLENVINVNGFDVIRPNYKQNADNCTGRSSSAKPNMQNIPKLNKKRELLGLRPQRLAFEAPKGYKMVLVDLDGSHGQIARFVAKDKKLIEANESGVKFHFYTVQGILAMEGKKADVKELAKAKKDKSHPLHQDVIRLYDASKTVFYGGLNMQSAKTLQNSFLSKADIHMPIEICQNYVQGFRAAYEDIYKLQKSLIFNCNKYENAKQFSYKNENGEDIKIGVFRGVYGMAKSIDGGRLFIEKMPNKYNNNNWEAKGTDAVSYMWLRTEGTIIKKSLGRLVNHIRQNRVDGWICQTTHDEIACVVKEEQAYELAKYMLNMITATFREFIPDYTVESSDPKDYIIDNWSQK